MVPFDSYSLLEYALGAALFFSSLFTLFLVTLPSRYSGEDRDGKGKKPKASVQIVVLGDIGRSPRMEYHALSIANHGGKVNIVGILDSDPHPAILSHPLITINPLPPSPIFLNTTSRLLILALAPLKALSQALSLYHALGYNVPASRYILLQNPPSIPTIAIALFVAFVRGSRLVIDWHNFGHTIYALKWGTKHPLVRLHKVYELRLARYAFAHLCVTQAMARVLRDEADVQALPLHDRPPAHFRPLAEEQRLEFLEWFEPTSGMAYEGEERRSRLVVSSTSWTADEDFGVLLDALVEYDVKAREDKRLPKVVAVITGKGPMKDYYLGRVKELEEKGKLTSVKVTTAWLSAADYALLLGSADLGVSLHTSSSGVDLPMKVVDMFGTGLPVVGWSKYEAWPELVQEDVNGKGFGSAEELTKLLVELFRGNGKGLVKLRKGALKECDRRWEAEWDPVAGRLFGLLS